MFELDLATLTVLRIIATGHPQELETMKEVTSILLGTNNGQQSSLGGAMFPNDVQRREGTS